MANINQELIDWATREARSTHRWAMWFLILYNWLALFSWAIAIAVPFGLAIMLYQSAETVKRFNIFLLCLSGFGLVLQVLNSVMRFKERASQGRNIAKTLEAAVLKYQCGQIDRSQFLQEVDRFVEKVTDEPLP
jgi:hypothetical protein